MHTPGERIALVPGVKPRLADERIAFTGRLATLSRQHAARLATDAGAAVVDRVTRETTLLVVGMLGWPLMNSGQLTRSLAEAERLRDAGIGIRIICESEFREAVGLEPPADSRGKSLTAAQVCAALSIDTRALQRWEHGGLVRAHEGRYDFRDLVSLRAVTNLVARGVRPSVIRKSLEHIKSFLPGVDRPLAQLNILVSASGELVAELEEALLTTTGQLEIRFDAAPNRMHEVKSISIVRNQPADSAAWIESGLEHEEAGDLENAERAYRSAVSLSPGDPSPHFNLGNVLLQQGRLEPAAEQFARAAALNPAHARAWFNLAHVQDARGDRPGARQSLHRAIAADPGYADAHYNLADLCDRLGEREAAEAAWSAYIRLDASSEWGREARRRLSALRKAGAWA